MSQGQWGLGSALGTSGRGQEGPVSVSRRGNTSLESVHCSQCAAATPILSWHDPLCVYCSTPLDVPPELLLRAKEHEHVSATYREEALQTAERLKPDLSTFTKFVAFLQLVVVGGGTAWWCSIVCARGGPTLLQLPLLASLAIGPLMFIVIVRNMAIDHQLVAAAELSFARLEVSSGLTGFAINLGCSNCGAKLGSSKLHGVTLDCCYCHATLLTPGFLISDSQQRFFRRILVLRGQLESKIEAPSLLAYGVDSADKCWGSGESGRHGPAPCAVRDADAQCGDHTGWLVNRPSTKPIS